jgi:hypothetical protein
MIAVEFTIELDIGLSFLLQAALPQLVTDRETKTHRRGRSSNRTAIADTAPRPSRQAIDDRVRRLGFGSGPDGPLRWGVGRMQVIGCNQ